ncbi:MAG: tyrosine-type recombinase/integrase [Rhodothermaceae bacterium]|nr:tyrosine-type recombinase/integrase [Rhodothermaceae bacterium]MYE63480.1 tyrosine-type recombinase/integrase [Rhodothermaceae bacterium]MYJ20198.1 tyrosine-type recombinase/integrase [Rhodothermaceae bacterium]
MSDGLLRGSELIHLCARDILFVEPDGTGRINLRRSKSDQTGEGAIVFLGKPVADDVKAYVLAGKIQPGDPLIQGISRGGNLTGRAMTIQGLNVTVKRLANAHLEIAEGVSSHSFRVGTAQSLASRGSGLVELQNAGRWKSPDMSARYTRSQAAARGAVARLLYP